jgi:uncharacterized protein YhdP
VRRIPRSPSRARPPALPRSSCSSSKRAPVAGWIGHFSDSAQAIGNGKLTLKFTLPLGNPEGVKVNGDYQFVANLIRLPGVPALSQVNGHLEFAEHSMQSKDLTADVFGGQAKIAGQQRGGHGAHRRQRDRQSRDP